MAKRDNLVRLRVEFEHVPIMDANKQVKDINDFDDLVGELKLKLFGK